MSEIKNNEKTIDNPPVKEEVKKPEDQKKQTELGNSLDRMNSSGRANPENKDSQAKKLEADNQKEIRENKARHSDLLDKKTESGAKLDNLSSTGDKRTEQKKLTPEELADQKKQDAVKTAFENSKAEELTADHKRSYGLENRENAEKLKQNPDMKPASVSYKELDTRDKQELSDRYAQVVKETPEENRHNARIPAPEKIKGVTSDGKIIEDWKPNTDGAKEGTRRMETPREGDTIDRIGSEYGTYFSPMKESGQPYSLKERATGDRILGNDITQSNAYHKYEVQKDFTRENFNEAITKSTELTNAEKINLRGKLEDYYSDCESTTSAKHPGEAYVKDGKSADGVKTAEAAPMFRKDDGGAVQFDMPFNAKELEKMGMIKEVKSETANPEDNKKSDPS